MKNIEYKSFNNWQAVLDHVSVGDPVYYQAPLDYRPVLIQARVSGKRVRVIPPTRDCDPFWADSDHLDRFRVRVDD